MTPLEHDPLFSQGARRAVWKDTVNDSSILRAVIGDSGRNNSHPGCLLSRQILRLPQNSLDLLDAYRYYLDITGLRYAELPISLTERNLRCKHFQTMVSTYCGDRILAYHMLYWLSLEVVHRKFLTEKLSISVHRETVE
jgi:hypothetical protein